ncbi:MAG: DEAD/DEAH box helicase [Gammaproteobacteria bacterium]|nr:DEAD/DEAH box helicase [Gammaproteobacteria bacterium]MBU1716529.1 DEAD/DEAH box helicase [Pseudomonadota bacterium]
MPKHDSERLGVADSVRASLAIEDTLDSVQARSFVRCLQTAWKVPIIKWRDRESIGQLDDARRLIHSARIYRQIEGASSQNAALCYRRAAELLEWLSRATDPLTLGTPIELFAAAAYQLGGLPAMASGLLGQVELANKGSRLYARFLKADFDGVLLVAGAFWRRHPELTTPEGSTPLLIEADLDSISWYITVELVRSLGLIADSLRRGDDVRLNMALAKIKALDRLAIRASSDDASMLISMLYDVAMGYSESSIYRPVLQLAELSPEHIPRLKSFARGQFSRGRGILWSSQRQGLDKLLHQSSFALCTPTGSGKTLVANLALVKELLLRTSEGQAPLALYLVPSRALAGEVEAKLTSELGQDLVITGLYGGADWGLTDYWLTSTRPTVLIATVEKGDALMRYLGPVLLTRLRLLIVDEAHQVVADDNDRARIAFAEHNSRSLRLESFVSRLLAQAPDIVRIALTAVAGGAATPVARWIEGRNEANAIGLQYRSTRQIIGMFETRPNSSGRMLLDLMQGKPLYVRERDEPVYISLQTPAMPELPPVMRTSIYRFNELSVLWTALNLVDDDLRILISIAQEPEKTMGWYKNAFELEGWQDVARFDLPENPDSLSRFQKTHDACVDYCGADSYEVALLNRGIATNHGQMPQRLRRLMTDLIERRICPITLATATLTEGVNLPFDLIFVTSLTRSIFDRTKNRRELIPLSIAEFNNLAGRAGRPGATKSIEGMTLVAVPQRPSSTANAQKKMQRRQIAVLKEDYKNLIRALSVTNRQTEEINSPLALLLNSISDRAKEVLGIERDQFLNWLEGAIPIEISDNAGMAASSSQARLADSVDELDSVLLGALEEFSRVENQDLEGAEAEAFLTDLWQKTFTNVAALQESWLEQAFIRRGRAVIEAIYPDKEERKRLYQYGFTPYVGRRFESVAPVILTAIEEATTYGLASSEERLAVFESLGEFLDQDRGYGFRVRDTQTDQTILRNWQEVLAWWMQVEDADRPEPSALRSWQRFVSENLEFRLGVAIGAVVSQAWHDGTDDLTRVPSLDTWRETTGLPWFGFWARELLRWGTLDPFVAYALANNLAHTRSEATNRRSEFVEWLQKEYDVIEDDDWIDPRLFQEWQNSLPKRVVKRLGSDPISATLTGSTGQRGRYNVIPLIDGDGTTINWIDTSGYTVAQSSDARKLGRMRCRDDFELSIINGAAVVRRHFVRH